MESLILENIVKLEEMIVFFRVFFSIEFLDIIDKELELCYNYNKFDFLIVSEIKKLYLKFNVFL